MTSSRPFLIVGFGSIGKRHANNLLTITKSPIIIFSKRKDIRTTDFVNYQLNKNRIAIRSDLVECIKENPLAALITNETSLHVKFALILAKKRIDLFIEKPLSNSSKNIAKLQSIVKKNNLVVMVGCNYRFYPPIRKMKELIDKKLVGRIISVQSENGSFLPDWHPSEDYSKGYAATRKLGGGVTLTQIHELDYLIWMFGNPKTIKSINGKFSDLKINVDDLSASIIKLENNIVVELHLDYFSRPSYKRLKIRGNRGVLYWDSLQNEIMLYPYKKQKWTKFVINDNYKLTDNVNPMYVEELSHFIKCVQKRKKPLNNLDESIKVLSTALAIKYSSMN